jgi:homoaconitase
MAFSGSLIFNPATDTLETPNGPFKFSPPTGISLPTQGYTPGDLSYSPSPSPTPVPETEIAISPDSARLEILEPFGSAFKNGPVELGGLRCLMRVKGKWLVLFILSFTLMTTTLTRSRSSRFHSPSLVLINSTTDHISAAGAWLKYKGHLSNISENTLMTAVNDEGGNINVARDVDGSEDTIPRTMQKYQQRGEGWMLVVDDNCMFASSFFPSSFSLAFCSSSSLSLFSVMSCAGPSNKLTHRWRGICS